VNFHRWIIAGGLIMACGCASHRASQFAESPATRPDHSNETLALDEIQPRPILARPAPATNPSQPSLDAIALFAKARDAQLQNQRYTAINLLESALKLDPDSFELNNALGQAYLSIGDTGDRSIGAFERAAQINPNDLEVQTELGRAYQTKGDLNQAIEHFRLAMQTDDYQGGDALAAVVDYRLALALQQKGYDRAALECYSHLLGLMDHADLDTRSTPEVNYLLARPELVYEEIAKLCERLGDYEQALKAYQAVAERSPTDFEIQSRVVETLMRLHRHDDAIAAATDLVHKFHASPESIELLHNIYRDSGSEGGFTDALRRLVREHPEDRPILFALADTLAANGRVDDAANLLSRSIDQNGGDVETVERLFNIYADRDQVSNAAVLIIRVTAAHPDLTMQVTPLFADLLRLSRKNSLRPNAVQKFAVPADAQASKEYWLWQVANTWGRPATAMAALDQSAHATAPFDPACRALLESYLVRSDWDAVAKNHAANALIDFVQSRDRADLAAELRGLLALRTGHPDQASQAFDQAVQQTKNPSPDLQLEYAVSLLRLGNAPRFEQLMQKLLADRPRFEAGYQLLLDYYRQNNAQAKMFDLVNSWLATDPNSINARVQQAAELIQQRRGDEAIALVRKLFQQRPDDGDVVSALVILMNASGQSQQAIDLLENERSQHPANRVAVEALVDIYAAQNRMSDATRVLDAAHAAVAGDPDLLYYVAHLYERIDQPQTTEQLLQEVIKVDPNNAPAGNDLGYTWADAGKNLQRAEALIRMAIDAEPDNPSYIDSLGWVLYKRGQFAESEKLLEQAATPAETADPVVLNHFGDVLYRLNRSDEAQQAWKKSLERMTHVAERAELRTLHLELEEKLHQAQTGKSVNVAPVVQADTAKPEQAKK
jgi:tetratricopeptide (TPR) repeat protein